VATTVDNKQKYWDELAEAGGVLARNLRKLVLSPGQLQGNVLDGGQFYGVGFMIVTNAALPSCEDPARVEKVDPYLAQNLLVNLAAEFPVFRKIGDWRDLTKEVITEEMLRLLEMVSHRRRFLESCEVSKSWGGQPSDDDTEHAVTAFLSQYQEGSTRSFYSCYLLKSFPPLSLSSSTAEIQDFINYRCGKKGISVGGRKAYYRAARAFYNWAFSPASGRGLMPSANPVTWVKPPKEVRKIMPAQDEKSLETLLSHVKTARDRSIISTLIDSGGRLSEISQINESDIIWEKHAIRAVAKGGREVMMPLSEASETLIREWLRESPANGAPIWGCKKSAIVTMLRRLEKETGIKCNAHTFRRGFASILRRKGVDSLDIMKLGHWKSITMVQRYTESVEFEDSQKHYQAPSGGARDTRIPVRVTRGFVSEAVVPRNRIELLTRGFSVRCSTY
jgi:integrase